MTHSVPSPVARVEHRSHDPEHAHRVLREAYVDFTVRPSGATAGFEFVHSSVVVAQMALGRTRYSTTAEMDVVATRDTLIVAMPRHGRIDLTSGRESVQPDPGRPVLAPADTDWSVRVSGVEVDAVTLDRHAMDRAARAMLGEQVRRPDFTSMLPVSDVAARYWAGVVSHVERSVLADDDVAASPLLLAEAVRSVAGALLVTFPNTALVAMGGTSERSSADPAVLRRAVAYIDEHAGEDVGIDDVANAARIGVRGLQHLFRRHRDCTPLEYLRQVRLARAHSDLQDADPTHGDTVATIASRWGFTHPGRFSVMYRQAYGRSPRETLRS